MHVLGITLHGFRRLEAEVIVAVRSLRRPTGINHIHLRRHLVGRSKPSFTDKRDDVVGVVGGKCVRRLQTKLLECIPNSIVRASLGKMIAGYRTALMLPCNDMLENGA